MTEQQNRNQQVQQLVELQAEREKVLRELQTTRANIRAAESQSTD